MSSLVANYRIFNLPSTPYGPDERFFKRVLGIGVLLWLVLVVTVKLMPLPPRTEVQSISPEVIKIIVQPPPPKPIEKKPEEKKEDKPKEIEPPKLEPQVTKTEVAKQKAQVEINKIQKELDALQDVLKLAEPVGTDVLEAKASGPSKADRTLIASNVAGGTSGINTAVIGSGVKGDAGSVGTHFVF